MDLWEHYYEGRAVVIPTNTCLKKSGAAVMGAGLAKQAADRFPELPAKYGKHLQQGRVCYVNTEYRIICVPTKTDWKQRSTIQLIDRALDSIIQVAAMFPDWTIVVPPLGCGYGGLSWNIVGPRIHSKLTSSQFVVLSPNLER